MWTVEVMPREPKVYQGTLRILVWLVLLILLAALLAHVHVHAQPTHWQSNEFVRSAATDG
jgi:hypothetical protein